MVNKQIEELTVTSAIVDPGGTEHTGTISGGGGNAFSHSGVIDAQSDAVLYVTEIADAGSFSVDAFTASRADVTPLPLNSSLAIATFDGSGNSSVVGSIQDFDGSRQFIDESDDLSYVNSSGSTEIIGVLFINNTNNQIDLYASGSVTIT